MCNPQITPKTLLTTKNTWMYFSDMKKSIMAPYSSPLCTAKTKAPYSTPIVYYIIYIQSNLH